MADEMTEAERTSRPIYRSSCQQADSTHGPSQTHHPCIAPATPVDQPSGDLTGGLDDQKAAEAFTKLEERSGEAKEVVPTAHGGRLQHAVGTEDPFLDRFVLCSLATKCPFDPAPATGIGIDREAIERPYEESGQNQPLCP